MNITKQRGGDELDIQNNTLVRHSLLGFLEMEFGVSIKEVEMEKIELARKCIEVYESPEEFFEKTGWAKDNPEISDFQYLLDNRICRWIEGKIWYFSRIQFEEGEKRLDEKM